MPPTAGSPVYLDLAYLPGGGAGHLDQDFFLRVRALCYVISGQGQRQEEGLRAVLDALLAGKQQWDLDLQVGRPQDSEVFLLRGGLCSASGPQCRGVGASQSVGPGHRGKGLWLRGIPHADQTARLPVCGTSAEEPIAQGGGGIVSLTTALPCHSGGRLSQGGGKWGAMWQYLVTKKVLR